MWPAPVLHRRVPGAGLGETRDPPGSGSEWGGKASEKVRARLGRKEEALPRAEPPVRENRSHSSRALHVPFLEGNDILL